MDNWLEIAVAACDHAGLQVGPIETLVTWEHEHNENAIYRLDGQRILKVYGPTAERLFYTECAALRTLEAHRTIPAPHIIAAGERPRGQPYIILTAIPGSTAEDVWYNLSRAERLAYAGELGTIFAAVHRLPQDHLAAVEQQLGDRNEHSIKREQARRTAEIIQATETLSVKQRDDLLRFLHEEASELLQDPPRFTHFDLSHHHVYLSRETGTWQVTGIIDWAEAVIGPPEWDVACLWHWTFNGVWHATFTPEWEAMQACLQTLYPAGVPERFARRCLAAHLLTPWMSLIWPHFVAREGGSTDSVHDLIEYTFCPQVFGPPD
jgi:hygromycin-B 7''-O-kinase